MDVRDPELAELVGDELGDPLPLAELGTWPDVTVTVVRMVTLLFEVTVVLANAGTVVVPYEMVSERIL